MLAGIGRRLGERGDVQAIGVHGLASVKLKVLEVGQELLLDVGLGTLLESSDGVGIGTLLLKLGLDSLEVACFCGSLVAAFWPVSKVGEDNSPLR